MGASHQTAVDKWSAELLSEHLVDTPHPQETLVGELAMTRLANAVLRGSVESMGCLLEEAYSTIGRMREKVIAFDEIEPRIHREMLQMLSESRHWREQSRIATHENEVLRQQNQQLRGQRTNVERRHRLAQVQLESLTSQMERLESALRSASPKDAGDLIARARVGTPQSSTYSSEHGSAESCESGGDTARIRAMSAPPHAGAGGGVALEDLLRQLSADGAASLRRAGVTKMPDLRNLVHADLLSQLEGQLTQSDIGRIKSAVISC
eukprot:NODE_524_length_896_cov_741.538371_g400_i0.p1 GENE.NODE_524_length_896_cov_741.538371_g400_i0~~NODE_524_length_896_cov_741.538371_g400_i0.p1  ORF type:complete len:266 (-),score=45.22 NODE_524_length_896_cov_741.538371_g400_i0:68-865(-)